MSNFNPWLMMNPTPGPLMDEGYHDPLTAPVPKPHNRFKYNEWDTAKKSFNQLVPDLGILRDDIHLDWEDKPYDATASFKRMSNIGNYQPETNAAPNRMPAGIQTSQMPVANQVNGGVEAQSQAAPANAFSAPAEQMSAMALGGTSALLDPEAEMMKAYQESIRKQMERTKGYEGDLSKLGTRPDGLMAMDLSPAAALVDSWTGSNLLAGYRGPLAVKEYDAKKAALQNAIEKSGEGVTTAQLNYLKLKAEEKKAAEDREMKRLMYGSRQSKGDFTTATKLRDAWDKHDVSKSYRAMEGAMNRIESSDTNDAAGDMSMIFAFMKMLDENSTVRESEYAQAERARGLDQTLQSWYQKAVTGEKLLPEQRAQFKNVARNIFKDVQKRKMMHDQDFQYLAQQAGVDPSLVVYTSRPGREGTGMQNTTGSMSSEDQAALQWANANPNDQRAIAIKQKLGVK